MTDIMLRQITNKIKKLVDKIANSGQKIFKMHQRTITSDADQMLAKVLLHYLDKEKDVLLQHCLHLARKQKLIVKAQPKLFPFI